MTTWTDDEAGGTVWSDNEGVAGVDSALTAHLNDTLAAHAATAISYTPTGHLAASTVQAAIDEHVTDLAATSGSSLVGFVQSGSGAITSTVQTALRLSVHTSQYSTQGNYETARDALTGTTGVNNLDVSGNIAVTGTVDGYDVSTMGVKLDGLPTSAIQDVGQNGTTSATPRGRINIVGGPVSDNSGSNSKDVFPFHYSCLSGNFTGIDSSNAQPVFDTAQDTFTLEGSMIYFFEAMYYISTAGTTSHSTSVLFGGTATFTSLAYSALAKQTATDISGTISAVWATSAAAVTVGAAAATATFNQVILKGTLRVNAAGTLIPQFKYSAAPGAAPVVQAGSYFRLQPAGTDTDVSKGAWA